ncbi:MAG TPA: hypothetical protein VF559_11845 [Caulobacteraceae bacterium]|jgi:hypothetical protein
MSNRVFFTAVAAAAALMAGLALLWPQGLGLRSPPPFGHAVADPNPKKPARAAPSLLPIPAEGEIPGPPAEATP